MMGKADRLPCFFLGGQTADSDSGHTAARGCVPKFDLDSDTTRLRGGGGSEFPFALAAPSAPDWPAGLLLHACDLVATPYEFTACDQVADCAAALGGTRSPPPLLLQMAQSEAKNDACRFSVWGGRRIPCGEVPLL